MRRARVRERACKRDRGDTRMLCRPTSGRTTFRTDPNNNCNTLGACGRTSAAIVLLSISPKNNIFSSILPQPTTCIPSFLLLVITLSLLFSPFNCYLDHSLSRLVQPQALIVLSKISAKKCLGADTQC